MKQCKIVFIGGGNMATSLIGGLLAQDCRGENLHVSDPDPARLDVLRQRYGVNVATDNSAFIAEADVVVLAVKPQVIRDVAAPLSGAIAQRRPLVISVAAGVRASSLAQWLGAEVAIVRTMPNTPALVGSGASALFANDHVSDEQRDLAESILRAVGLAVWVEDEAMMDAVTALSGSGPAYFFLVMEAMEKAAAGLGLPQPLAHLLTLQTAYGAAKMALESDEDIARLRERVTSPGGTTERALTTLREGGLEPLFASALKAACERSRELADMLGGR